MWAGGWDICGVEKNEGLKKRRGACTLRTAAALCTRTFPPFPTSSPRQMQSLLRPCLALSAGPASTSAPARGLVIVASTRPQWKVRGEGGRGPSSCGPPNLRGAAPCRAAAVRGWGLALLAF